MSACEPVGGQGFDVAVGGLTPAAEVEVEVEPLATVSIAEAVRGRVFFGLAHVVVPPGGRLPPSGALGPRLIAVESGELTVTALSNAASSAGLTDEVADDAAGRPADDLTLGSGDRIGFEAGRLGAVRNDGVRPSVFLDAALLPASARPNVGAFTTGDGISFQLLVGVVVERLPEEPTELRLSRYRPRAEAGLPTTARPGPLVGYVESGTLRLEARAGVVEYSRAAAAAPASAAGPMRSVAAGTDVSLTAGGSFFLAERSVVVVVNPRDVPLSMLVVEVAPSFGPPASVRVNAPTAV